MYKLLIVEDENKTRAALKDYVPWAKWDIATIYEAANGQQALALALDVEPDIVITDIRMPEMDGAQLAGRLAEQLPDTVIIMLSAYSDLAYLKSAMKASAVDYLLKPVDMSELEQAVKSAIRRLQAVEERRSERELLDRNKSLLRDEFLLSMLEARAHNRAEVERTIASLGLELPIDARWHIAAFRFEADTGSGGNLRMTPAVKQAIQSVIQHAFREFDGCLAADRRDAEWTVFAWNQPRPTAEPRTDVQAAAADAADRLLRHVGIAVKAFANNDGYGLLDLHKAMGKLEPAADAKTGVRDSSPAADRQNQLVQEIKAYIERHYIDETLTVNDIAEHLNYTSAYVCMIFKRATGMTVNYYLNAHRIRQAKRMLEDPDLKIFEIAVSVGYNNENYFSKVFRKYENQTPSDYRRGKWS